MGAARGGGIARALAAVGLAVGSASAAPPPRLLGVEHVPIAVGDLEATQRRFAALGFTLKPGRAHANGLRNAHVKFADGSYLELITAPAPTDALATAYRRLIAAGDAPAFLSLYVATLAGLADRLAASGARDEDDGVTFPAGPLDFLFFGTRQRSPTDRPAFFVHANGAMAIARVWLAPDDPRPCAVWSRSWAAAGAGRARAWRCACPWRSRTCRRATSCWSRASGNGCAGGR